MKSKDQQLLEEAYEKVVLLNESMIMDFIQWISGITGADSQTLYTMYVKDLMDTLAAAGLYAAGLLAIGVIAVAQYLKLNLPQIKEKMRQSRIGKQVAELLDKHGTDPEILSLLESLRALKGDRSKEATAERKAIGVKLKQKIEGTGVFDKGDDEAMDTGVKALKDNY
jgi:hypothetical protein